MSPGFYYMCNIVENSTMKLLILQTDIEWNDRAANLHKAAEMIASAPSADLIILPEMFTTGFATAPTGVAENDGATLAWMRQTTLSTGAAMAGSVAVEESGKYYNRFYFVRPDGSFDSYDKRHLFSFAGEDREYTAGTERVVVEWKGFRILLQVCYDLRFPVFARCRGDYDMIIYTANWPTVRIDAWNSLLKARAIENLCYVAAVNRVGNDPYTSYSGGTYMFDFIGKRIAEAAPDAEQAVFVEIEREKLDAFRQKFPALDDADNFRLER